MGIFQQLQELPHLLNEGCLSMPRKSKTSCEGPAARCAESAAWGHGLDGKARSSDHGIDKSPDEPRRFRRKGLEPGGGGTEEPLTGLFECIRRAGCTWKMLHRLNCTWTFSMRAKIPVCNCCVW